VNSVSQVLPFIRNNLDGILALIGAIFSIVLIAYLQVYVWQPAYTVAAALAFVACVAYLVLRQRRKLLDISSILNVEASPPVLQLLDIIFFALFIYSLWSFAFRSEQSVIPLGYFVSIAAMTAILGAKILFLPSKTSRVPFTLLQIIIIALSLSWSVPLLFPSLIGIDPWYHKRVTLDMLNEAHLGADYRGLPVMHLTIGANMLITGLSYKMAAMFSVSSLQVVCNILFVFLIGRLLFNAKIGMLAALLVGIANWHIFFSHWTIPNALGATFVVIILYLVIKFHKDRTIAAIPLFVVLMVALVLTHSIAALWLAILLFAFWLGFLFYSKFFKEKLAVLPLLAVALIFTIAMLSWWTFGTGHIGTLGALARSGFEPAEGLTYAPGTAPLEVIPPEVTPPPGVTPPPEVTPTPEVTPPPEVTPAAWETLSGAPFEFMFNSLGMLLFFAVSFIGGFYMLSKRFSNPYAFFIAIAGILILAIGFFPMLTGRSVIEHRWWYMAEILVSIPLAVAFFLLSGLFKKRHLKASLVIVLVFILAFLSIIGLQSNQTQRTFSQNQITRFAITTAESQALQTAGINYDGKLGIDSYYTIRIRLTPEMLTDWLEEGVLPLKGRFDDIHSSLLTKNFSQYSDDMLLIREEIVDHPFGTGSGCYYKLNYDPRQYLAEQGFNKVYDCGSVSGFAR